MRRCAFAVILMVAVVLFAPHVQAQPKPKDPVLQQNIIARLDALSSSLEVRLAALDQRLNGLEAELNRLKQGQADLSKQQAEGHNTARDLQNLIKANEVELRNIRVQSSGDILGISNGLGNLRAELAILTDTVKRGFQGGQGGQPSMAQQPVAPTRPSAATIEGYVNASLDDATQLVQISLGRAQGIQVGKQFSVYRTNDPGKSIGILEVTQVVDDNNSKARIIYQAQGIKFEFGDIVRPM